MKQHSEHTHQGTRRTFHGVKTKEREMTGDEIKHLMFKADVGRIVTIGKDGHHITPLSFVFYEDSIYIHSRPKGKKLENIEYNPNVCFEVDEVTLHANDKIRWKSVIIYGMASQIMDANEIINALSAMKQKSQGIMPTSAHKAEHRNGMPDAMLKQLTVIKIKPFKISSRLNEQL